MLSALPPGPSRLSLARAVGGEGGAAGAGAASGDESGDECEERVPLLVQVRVVED